MALPTGGAGLGRPNRGGVGRGRGNRSDPFGLGSGYGLVAPNPIIPGFGARPDPRHPNQPNVTHVPPPQPVIPPPPQPVAPSAPKPAGSSSSPGSPALDAQYFANVAANQAKINSMIGGFQEQQGLANTLYQNQIGTLNYQQPRAQLGLEQKANAAGTLYSSAEGQRQGDLVTQFGDRRTAAAQANAMKQADLTSRIAGERASEGQYENSQAWASALRASVAAAQNPPPAQAPKPPAPKAAPPKPPSKPAPRPPSRSGRGPDPFGLGRRFGIVGPNPLIPGFPVRPNPGYK